MHLILRQSEVVGDVILVEVFLNLLIAAEHAQTGESPETAVGAFSLHITGPRTVVGIVEIVFQHLVVVVAETDTSGQIHILAEALAPSDDGLDAPHVHLAVVLRSGIDTHRSGKVDTSGIGKHLTAEVVVGIEGNGQAVVEHAEVDTHIGLGGLVPVDVGIGTRFLRQTERACRSAGVGSGSEEGTAIVLIVIELQPAPGIHIVASHDTEGSTDLQEVDEQLLLREPGLFRNHPSCREGGEGAPIVLGSKLGGSLCTDEELEEVLVGIGVVETSDISQRTTFGTVPVVGLHGIVGE